MSDAKEGLIAALKAAHAFPHRYTFKVIGENTPLFEARAIEVVRLALPEQTPEISTRKTKSGRHQSVTLTVTAPTPEVIADLHIALGRIPSARFVL